MTGKVIDLLTEFDEMGYIPTTFTENAEQAAIDWKNRLVAAIEAENAALRERLDKAVELPDVFNQLILIIVLEEGNVPRLCEAKVYGMWVDPQRRFDGKLDVTIGAYDEVGVGHFVFGKEYRKTWFLMSERTDANKVLSELGGEK